MNLGSKLKPGLLASAATVLALGAHAAAPPAGTVIGNRAAATYVNASGDTVSITSNEVETVVQQVAGVTLVTDSSETVAPGGKVFLPHQITNEGNGTDIFDLAAIETDTAGDPFDFTSIVIYADANFDGIADSTTPITVTPAMAAGDRFGILIEATVPQSAAPADLETITITAASDFDGSVVSTNTDTVTISSGAITELSKSMTVTDGTGAAADGLIGPGDTVTVRIDYSSTGLVDATDLVVTDQLDAALEYVPGSATWSDSASGLSDIDEGYELTNGGGQQIDFRYDGTDTVTFQIDNTPSGRTGFVRFTALIAAGTGAGDIDNVATQTVDGTPQSPSNDATVTVDTTYAVTAADARSSTHAADPDNGLNLVASPGSATDDDGLLNDVVTESSDAYQGAPVRFEFVITNQSNTTETVDLSVANGSFPSGTTFQLLASDNATPIVGGVGPLASGASATVNVVATLPTNAAVTAAGATNYEATLSAQATSGGAVNTSTGRFTGAVLGAAVDLQNANGTGDGANPTNGGDPWIDTPTNPGQPASFVVTVENNGPRADAYTLALDTPLPPGWTTQFFLPDGTPVTSTGAIPSGGDIDITVVVTPPADATPVDQPVTLRVASPSTGQSDTLTNAVVVNTIVDVAITPPQTVQVSPGGVQDIPHTLRNLGNVGLTEGAISLGGLSGFSGALFHDVDGDGAVGPADVPIDNIDDIAGGLPAGTTTGVILRVQAPASAVVGFSETAVITVSETLNSAVLTEPAANRANNTVEDQIIIVSNDLTLGKAQALDAACNGVLGTFTANRINAKPGQCVRYRITATNTGTSTASTVKIQDTTPGYTALTECGGACAPALTPAGAALPSRPADGSGGSLESTHGDLLPGELATLAFTVKIDE